MSFLLSTQALADFISRKPNAVRRWAEGQPPIGVAASVLSIGAIAATIEADSVPQEEAPAWRRYLTAFEDRMHREGRLLVIDRDVTRVWASIRELDLEGEDRQPVGEDEKLVWSTAIAHGLVLVGKRSSGTDRLQALGLQVHDPDESA